MRTVNEAVIISLRDRTERLHAFHTQIPRPWPFPQVRVHPGVRQEPPPWFQSGIGAWGCRTAHLQVLQSAWDRGIESTLIMEDDALFVPDFTRQWKALRRHIPADTAMLMLGGEHVEPPTPVESGWVRCHHTRRTHAYVIRIHAIPLLMRIWTHTRRHIDNALTELQHDANVYAPETFLVGQNSGWSDIAQRTNPDPRFWN